VKAVRTLDEHECQVFGRGPMRAAADARRKLLLEPMPARESLHSHTGEAPSPIPNSNIVLNAATLRRGHVQLFQARLLGPWGYGILTG
jgi:hypothetical protein